MWFASSFVATKDGIKPLEGSETMLPKRVQGRVYAKHIVRKTHGVRGIIIHEFVTSSGNVYSTPSSQAPSYATVTKDPSFLVCV